jgi:hypothetical protein
MSNTKFYRFSMCNCLTIRMDQIAKKENKKIRTYTAHLMTPSVFLAHACPGKEFTVPFHNFWARKDYIKIYKFPKHIKTFLLSPFNEVFHKNYTFYDSTRYAIPLEFTTSHKMKQFENVGRLPVYWYRRVLKKLNNKIDKIYPNSLKVLIFYSYTRAPQLMKRRALVFQKAAKETLQWPCIRLIETAQQSNQSWQHYSTAAYRTVLDKLEKLEEAHGR